MYWEENTHRAELARCCNLASCKKPKVSRQVWELGEEQVRASWWLSRSFHGSSWVEEAASPSLPRSPALISYRLTLQIPLKQLQGMKFRCGSSWPCSQEGSRWLWNAPGTALKNLNYLQNSKHPCMKRKEKLENIKLRKGFGPKVRGCFRSQ